MDTRIRLASSALVAVVTIAVSAAKGSAESYLLNQTFNCSYPRASQDFEPSRDSSDSVSADDFIVPEGTEWLVQRIRTVGYYSTSCGSSAAGPASAFNVVIYQDGGSSPGAVLASESVAPTSDGSGFFHDITPIRLGPGHYWVSVQAQQNCGTNGQWFWYGHTPDNGSPGVWRNPSNGFGTGCTSWTPAGSCGATYNDRCFGIATLCGDGATTAGEVCDDGNLVDGDGCDSNCLPTGCGNGVVAGAELCDDGNQVDGDGCSANCSCTGSGAGSVDSDGDGYCDLGDNCPSDSNPSQADTDSDAVGDACDVCVGNGADDVDGDSVCSGDDNCPTVANADQADADASGVGDACNDSVDADGDEWEAGYDNCPSVANPSQFDTDGDGFGDACDTCSGNGAADTDSDSICDLADNCPAVANVDQSNLNGNSFGDVCEPQGKLDNAGCYSASDTIAPPDGSEPVFAFSSISGSGATLSLSDDQVSSAVSLGFNFEFYGSSYSQVYVSSNGFLTFAAGQPHGCCSGPSIPNQSMPNNYIAGLWNDLYPPNGAIYYQTLGAAPARRFVVQFQSVPQCCGTTLPSTWQVVLHESTNEIAVYYIDGQSGSRVTTAGIENQNGRIGLRWGGPAPMSLSNQAVRYSPTQSMVQDSDSDGLRDCLDNCPLTPNPGQEDSDLDGTGDVCQCGDSVVLGLEACDDGNLLDGDGCDSNCQVTACGNGVVTAGEVCDDGNVADGDGCSGDCSEVLGDGVVDVGESCDDANTTAGDGCNAAGRIEDCWTCTGQPSVCTPQAPTITTVDSIGIVGRYANMAIGSDGLPVIAYYDDSNDRIKVAHCNNASCTSSTTSVVDATVGNFITWQHGIRIIIGGDGLPFLAYHHPATGRIGIAHCSNVACTSSTISTLDARPGLAGAEPGLTLGSDGFPFITHGDSSSNERRAIHCLDATCSSRNAGVMSSFYRYGHTTLGADGFALNVQGQGDVVRASRCSTRDCSSGVTSTNVLGTIGSPNWISATDLDVAPNGLGFFTYHDGATGGLGVARCSNTSCTSVTTSLVDGNVGATTGTAASSSILFAADGRARIAYWDTDDGDLRLATCHDAVCSTSSTMLIDSAGNVGRDASMVRSGERLLISYFDTTNSDLKVAYCAGTSGNGVVDNDEQCDDGNLVPGDGCDASGLVETCYDCSGAPSVCTSHCGDGVLDPDEDCDDGDLSSGDGCSATGQVESCYTCTGQPSVCTMNCGSDGALDPTFDTDGKVTTVFNGGTERANAMAFLADGKIVAVGYTGSPGSYDTAVARYNPDGSLDTTFSGDGKLVLNLAGENDMAYAVAVQGDGRIVVAGASWAGSPTGYDVSVVRLNADGTLDTSFSGDGVQYSGFGGDERAYGVAVQSDGKIVVGGLRGNGVDGDFLAVRYNADGTNDSTFSGDGYDVLDVFGTASYDQASSVAIQSDGRILVAGTSTVGGVPQFLVVRYNTGGTLDATFSGDGKVATPMGGGNAMIHGIALQPDGKIVAAGEAYGAGAAYDFALARYNPDGSLDTTFSSDGKLLTAFGSANDVARAVKLRSDGRIVAAGHANMSGDLNFAVARYLSNGDLDTSFAGDGRATTAIGAGVDNAYAAGIDAAGRTVAAGESYNGSSAAFALVRYAEATCGDGNVQSGEQCDDGNVAGGDCCSASCQYETAGSVCADDGLVCSTDLCNGSGICVHAAGNAGASCRGSAGICDLAETCTGASTACPSDAKSTSVCRTAAGECDLVESCNGVADTCPADARKSGGIACTSDGNVCTNDVCDGSSVTCTHPANTAPCNDGQYCNGSDTCSGGSCSVHTGDPCTGGSECANACNEAADNCFDLASTPCSADGNVCTDDVCDGAGGCGVNNTAPCNDGVFCNGADTCAGGVCTHAGSPCPETDCNSCQEATDSCFDPEGTACLDEPDQCTNDRCDGAGACEHTPIALAEVCNWAIVAGNEDLGSKVRTRLSVAIGGGVCADKADVGVNTSLDDGSWAMQRDAGTTLRFRGAATVGTGSVSTGGGCIKGSEGILGTGYTEICCEDGIIPLAGGGEVNACGNHDDLAACTLARAQVADDIALLDALSSTQSIDALNCSLAEPCVVTAGPGLNVIDVPKVSIQTDSVLTVDGGGYADSVVILRIAKGMKGKPNASLLLAGGLDASRFAIYARDGGCKFGDSNSGSGTLFCPNGKVQFKLGTIWHGSIGAGSGVNLNDYAVLDHVPFTGLAD